MFMKMKRKVGLFLFSIVLVNACATPQSTPIVKKSQVVSPLQSSIVSYGMSYLNAPYRYAGKGPSVFDCSGFTSFVFRKFGYRLPGSSRGQAKEYPKVGEGQLLIGDLVFFEGRRKNGRVGHVGIVTEVKKDGSFDFVHASVSRGVIVSSSAERYYAARYLKAGRVLDDEDLALGTTTDTLSVAPLEAESVATTSTAVVVATEDIEVEQDTVYVVRKGDTLYRIARKHGCTVTELKEWNPGLRTLIHAGDELLICTEP